MFLTQSNHPGFVLVLIAIFCSILLMSCKTLVFKNMFGTIAKIENPKDYEGYWESDEGIIVAVKISKDSTGLIMGYIKWNDNDKFTAHTNEKTIITKINDDMFINIQSNDVYYDVKQFEFWKSKYTDKIQLRMWDPDVNEFENLVSENIIPGKIVTKINDDGEVETDSVIVDHLSEKLLNQIIEQKNLFDYKNVQTFRLISRPNIDPEPSSG